MEITINGTAKNVEFKPIYTRLVDREFNNILFGNSKASTKSNDVEIELKNMQLANDYLVMAMTNLTQEDIDQMDTNSYNEILKRVGEIKNGSN
jgi:hypothetical protein